MTDGSSDNQLFPEIGAEAHLYLNHNQTRKTEQANHALKLLQIDLLIASILVAAPILFQLRGLNQFEIFVVNLYTLGGAVFWLLSVGAATSAFISSRASLNPELTVFENYLRGEFDDEEFREYLGAISTESKRTSGECFWLLTISAAFAVVTVLFFGLSVVDSVTAGSIAYLQGLWPLLILGLLAFLPSTVLGIIGRFRPNSIYLNFNSKDLDRHLDERGHSVETGEDPD
ncbi:hypothetical protein [Halobacterium rubrum]|uniref:hypothetical protein n=1 Tax=Halobacterium TaxID=2239 RepID=UPI001F16B2F8|nr:MULTISPECIES: hypothetical protein [Halobacterium]MDH5020348.1 hypothetical protein [Halobacterium rubrum]